MHNGNIKEVSKGNKDQLLSELVASESKRIPQLEQEDCDKEEDFSQVSSLPPVRSIDSVNLFQVLESLLVNCDHFDTGSITLKSSRVTFDNAGPSVHNTNG